MKRLIATSPAVLGGIAAVTLVAGAGAAIAAWRVQSDEVVLTAETATLSPGNKPVVSAAGNVVTVSWTPNTFGERKVDSYRIQRYDLAGSVQQPQGTCEENVAKESCADSGVPTGSWRYTVVPVKGGWTGPESAKSDAVIVAADGKAVVVPDPAVEKPAGPAAGPAVVAIGDPAQPAATPAPGSPPAWTVQPGTDGVLGTDDTLTYAGGAPVAPGDVVTGWDGKARPVTVVAEAGAQPVLTVDDGATRVFGPLAVPPATVPANATFDATLAEVQGRIVVTLGAPRVAPAPDEAATAPADPTAGADPTTGGTDLGTNPGTDPGTGTPETPAAPTPGTETTETAEPGGTPSTTESAGGDEPATGDTSTAGTEGEPDAPATDAAATSEPAAEVSPSTATSDAAVVLVAT
ncbi:hypothetical protein SAMN05421812_113150 [Asanoa hainanensis]|uniref:Fibronectin type-III domain-containing protein n=1 Tax=Asanoa hainanensis TaxID=560556 RepID=A0A239P4N1_9ACTN|nr:hypothetical protein [Asanoa hainanensis]SNT61624.1 hypothetical protein SAMN05421812_113150 [Asanoa hainanensis]